MSHYNPDHKSYCSWPSDPCDCGAHKQEFKTNRKVSDGYDSGYAEGKAASRKYYKKVVEKLKQQLTNKKWVNCLY